MPNRRKSGVSRDAMIDLSPMTFAQVEWKARQLVIDPPLALETFLDEESGQLYVLVQDDLGIHVFAQTPEQLAAELVEQLFFLWDACARESQDRLTAPAQRLREALLARMREDELDVGERTCRALARLFHYIINII
jgi:hypothetical protein